MNESSPQFSIHYHEEVESTSSSLLNYLSDNGSPPVAVAARSQTCGRGRRGNSWSSPDGNLYISIAIPSQWVTLEEASLVPCKTACLVANWLESVFGFRPTLKWPNDLLFAGRKLGGILCESTVIGQEISQIILGIGINLTAAPSVAEQETICIDKIVGEGRGSDWKKYAQSLYSHIIAMWQNIQSNEIGGWFERYAVPQHHFWRKEGMLFSGAGLGKNGDLLLKMSEGKETISVSTSTVDLKWVYQRTTGKIPPVCVADMGNSRLKIAVFDGLQKDADPDLAVEIPYSSWEGIQELATKLKKIFAGTSIRVFGSGVGPKTSDEISKKLSDNGINLFKLLKRPVRLRLKGYPLQELGIDRLAAMEAALSKDPFGSPLVVVSAGTAVTIDCIDPSGNHLGGYILPGMQTKIDSLSDRAELLPHFIIGDQNLAAEQRLGLGTREAMGIGAVMESLAMIRWVADGLKTKFGLPKIVITGGDRNLLKDHLDADFDPYLVVKGLKIMVLGGEI